LLSSSGIVGMGVAVVPASYDLFHRFGLGHKTKWLYIGCIAVLMTRRAP
jgi:hypothetical protein